MIPYQYESLSESIIAAYLDLIDALYDLGKFSESKEIFKEMAEFEALEGSFGRQAESYASLRKFRTFVRLKG